MERDAEIVVVGAGVAGLAAARALAGDGRDVLLLEQFELGHARGSSHGATRIFRLSYPEPHWVRLAQASLPLWRELEREAGEPLLSTEGSLDVGAPEPNRAALAACGAAFELLDAQVAERRFSLTLPPGAVLHQPDGGVLRADRALAALLASALAAGARVVERTRVVALKEEGAGVRIDTAAGALRARAAVVTAGAWAAALLAGAGIELPVVATRETVCHFRLPGAPPRPSLIDWLTPSTPAYGTARAGQLSSPFRTPGSASRRDSTTRGRPPTQTGTASRTRRPCAGSQTGSRAAFRTRIRSPPKPSRVSTRTPRTRASCSTPGSHRRRLGVQRPRLQVRPRDRAHARGARARGRALVLSAALVARPAVRLVGDARLAREQVGPCAAARQTDGSAASCATASSTSGPSKTKTTSASERKTS